MLTLNVIGRGDDKLLNGTLCGEKFNLPYSVELYDNLKAKQVEFETFTSGDQVSTWEEEVKALLVEEKEDVIETACPDLKKDNKTGYYYIVVEGEVSKTPVPDKLVAVILESIEKEISPEPIVKAWIRFLRNPNFYPGKGELFASYITALVIDDEEVGRLIEEEGFTYEKAVERATYNDVMITTQGLIVTKKYAELITEGWEIDPKTNEAVKVSLFPKTPKTVDKITGVVGGEKIIMPDFVEELYFQPAVQKTSGDEFFSGDTKGHIVQVGKVHKLENWNQVDVTDCVSCRCGLHSGGISYVANYKHLNTQLLECFVDPAEIGAIVDTHNSDGAIRSKEYFVYGAVKGRCKGIYHSSTYAKMKDDEWEAYKLKAVEEANKIVEELQKSVDNLGK